MNKTFALHNGFSFMANEKAENRDATVRSQRINWKQPPPHPHPRDVVISIFDTTAATHADRLLPHSYREFEYELATVS